MDYIKLIANGLKMKILTDMNQIEKSKFISANLYAKTKLGIVLNVLKFIIFMRLINLFFYI